MSLAFCSAHVRRKFYKLAENSQVANEVQRRIASLYAIEGKVRGSQAEERRPVRHDRRRIIAANLRQYLEARNRQVGAKSKLGEAIPYALTHRDGLARLLDDGRIDLDTLPSNDQSGPWSSIGKTLSSLGLTKALTTGP